MNSDRTFQVELRQDWCKGCYLCLDVCPVKGIFDRETNLGIRGFRSVRVNSDGCTGCLLCELLCPDLAITVTGQILEGGLSVRS